MVEQKTKPKNRSNNMFRKLLIAGVTTTGLIAGTAMTPNAAQAHEHWHVDHYRHYYPPVRIITEPIFDVYCGGPECMEFRRAFYSRLEADRYAADLRCHGFRADVRCR